MTNEIYLVSAGTPQLGIVECINVYSGHTGIGFNDVYMTYPEIKTFMQGNGTTPDIMIAPARYME